MTDLDRSVVKLVESPMLRAYGPHADPDLKCEPCKHCGSSQAKIGQCKGQRFPACELRGPKPHDPQWPACAKFLSWSDWRKQRDEEASKDDASRQDAKTRRRKG